MRAPTLIFLLTVWDPYSRCDYPDAFSIFTFIGCLCVLNLWINLRRQDNIIKRISILHNTQFSNIPVPDTIFIMLVFII